MSSQHTNDLLKFLESSPTPYHAVDSAVARLTQAGFLPLSEGASFSGEGRLAAGRYYVVRADSTILAFVLPPHLLSGEATLRGFRIIGAHTDSPNLRLKPRPEYNKEGYLQLGVEVYGGVLLNSWLDRDLGLAGQVIVRKDDGHLSRHLLNIRRPLLRVPQLAIHLDRDVTEKGLVLNKQDHMVPILGLSGFAPPVSEGYTQKLRGRERLYELIGAELLVQPENIVTCDLMLYDLVPPTLAGLHEELIFSGRLDNQAMCHAALAALCESAPQMSLEDGLVPVVVLFDHEEVGSGSDHGAAGPMLPTLLERITLCAGLSRDGYHRALAASICLSADMAHAVHPNYVERSEARHRPQLNGGPVVKVNSQQRYATCAQTAAFFEELCRQVDVPCQSYVHRTDLPCGSTIGPITATLLGIRTVDVGNPMLSMHSIRELGGARDPEMMIRVMGRFLRAPDPFVSRG